MTTPADRPTVSPIRDGYAAVTPYVPTGDAGRFMDFVQQVFGATERVRYANEDGTIGHGELDLNGSVIMTFDVDPAWSPTPSFLSVYVEDCDAVHQRALDAGAVEVTRLSTNFYGDRGSRIRDPFGNIWWIQTRVEEVSEEEQAARLKQATYLEDLQDAQETLRRELLSRQAMASARVSG